MGLTLPVPEVMKDLGKAEDDRKGFCVRWLRGSGQLPFARTRSRSQLGQLMLFHQQGMPTVNSKSVPPQRTRIPASSGNHHFGCLRPESLQVIVHVSSTCSGVSLQPPKPPTTLSASYTPDWLRNCWRRAGSAGSVFESAMLFHVISIVSPLKPLIYVVHHPILL